MRLSRLILEDFISYEYLDYSFENKPLLVQGLNLTDDGQKTNGVGKSVIPTAIEQCIAGTNSRGVNDSELVTYGKKSARVQLYASCDIRKEEIHIDNTINIKGANSLMVKTKSYSSKEWKQANYSTVPDGKKFVSEWFGISKEDLFNYFIINNTRFKSFFKSSNTEKVALINRFSDASIMQGIEDIDLEDLEEEERASKTNLDSVSGKIEHLIESIAEEESRDFKEELEEEEQEIDAEIEKVLEEIALQEQKIQDKENSKPAVVSEISDLKKEAKENAKSKKDIEKEILSIDTQVKESLDDLEKAYDLVEKFKSTNFKAKKEALEDEIREYRKEGNTYNEEKRASELTKKKVLKLLENIEVKLSGAITCPSCEHVFILDGDIDELESKKKKTDSLKKKVETSIIQKQTSIDEVLENIVLIEESISKINAQQAVENEKKNKLSISANSLNESINKVREQLSKKKNELGKLELKESRRISSIKNLESQLEAKDAKIESFKEAIKLKTSKIDLLNEKKAQLKEHDNTKVIEGYKKSLRIYKKQLASYQLESLEIKEKLTKKRQWIQNFKQFRMYLANQSLTVIEYHCNRYLQEMKSDLTVKIEGFKMKADNTIKEEITCSIIRNIERNFNSFSGGERGRLLFASILANRFMINETHPYGGLDFLSIDEVFEGVDSEGLVSLIESAKLLSIPVLLITHVSVEEDDNVLTIVKENGVSKIKY